MRRRGAELSDGVRVAKDTVVTIEYSARLDDGTLVDSTDACGPISYLHGNEQIFPPLEQRGRRSRSRRGVGRWSLSARGELRRAPRETLMRRMPRAQLPPELALGVGERYTLRSPDGRKPFFRLVAVEGDEVVADFNSRAAGQGMRDPGQGARGASRDAGRDPPRHVALSVRRGGVAR